MLSLDDARWSLLNHAFGSAEDIPPMIKTLKENFQSGDETELFYDYLFHQYTTYSATYAAIPHIAEIAFEAGQSVKNQIEIADYCGSVHAFRNWDIRNDINSDDEHIVKRLSQEINSEYLKAIEKIKPLCEKLLSNESIEKEAKHYSFNAFLALKNQEQLSQILYYNSPEEIIFPCPNCDGEIYLSQEGSEMVGYGEEYVFNKNAKAIKLIPAQLNSQDCDLENANDKTADWLLYLSERYDVEPTKYQIPYLFGEMICPHCEQRIKILESIYKQYS